MALFNASVIIKELRNAKKLSQEQLAEGICSRSTIAMIELGKRKPDWHTFRLIMDKLGVNSSQFGNFGDIASEDEIYIFNHYTNIHKLVNTGKWNELKIEIDKMEQDEKFSSGYGLHTLRLACRALYTRGPNPNFDIAAKYMMDELKENRPNFDIDEIHKYVLTTNEMALLSNFAFICIKQGEIEKAIKLRHQLIAIFEQNYSNMSIPAKINYCMEMGNLAAALYSVKRYNECAEIADKCMRVTAGDFTVIYLYMHGLYFKACALLSLGQKEEGEMLFKRYLLYTYSVCPNLFPEYSHESSKRYFEEQFGYKLDLSLPW